MARTAATISALSAVAAAGSVAQLRAQLPSRADLPADNIANWYKPRLNACSACVAGSFSQLQGCLISSTNVCIELTASFVFPSTITINKPSFTYITSTGSNPVTLSGGGYTQLFLVRNVDADLVLENLNLVGGATEFAGYQGGGGAVQITGGNLTMVGVVVSDSVALQQEAQQDIGGGAISCMDQANTLVLAGCGFGGNLCYGCSGGAVFSSCQTYVGNSVFINNSVTTNDPTIISGNAIRAAQINTSVAIENTTVGYSGIMPGTAAIHAVSVTSVAFTTVTLLNNVTVVENVGGGVRFYTDTVLTPSYQFIVGNSTFINNTATSDAGGAINVQLYNGAGGVAISDSAFESNIGAVGGAISVVNTNVTNNPGFYVISDTFVCNAALAGDVANAINNGDTKGGYSAGLYVATSNFVFAKGCRTQNVLGQCAGQCPR